MGMIVKAGLFGALAVGAAAGASQLDWRKPERPAIAPATEPPKLAAGVPPAPPIATLSETPNKVVEIKSKPAVEENKALPQKARKKHRKRRRE